MKTFFAVFLLVSVVFSVLGAEIVTPVKATTTWIVPEDFATIQEAVYAASPGDTVIVNAGTYAEGQIKIYRRLTLLANGTVTIDGLKEGNVLLVSADSVIIEGFTVVNSGVGWGLSGILLQNVQDCVVLRNTAINNTNGIGVTGLGYNVVKENLATDNQIGIGLYNTRSNAVEGNTVRNNLHGIRLYRSHENLIKGNVAIDNGVLPGQLGIGIYLEQDSDLNSIEENFVSGNRWTGIMAWGGSDLNVIAENDISESYNGMYLAASKNNMIQRNAIDLTSWAGIKLRGACKYNTIIGNTITNMHATGPGFFIWDHCDSNVFAENLIADVPQWVYFDNSSDNVLYHNSFINAYTPYGIPKMRIVNSTNIWDNGYPSGGNYWSDYTGADLYSGPHQNETGSDGIGDDPYLIYESNQDNYPLMNPYLPGDINHDGTVDVLDAILLISAWGSQPGDSNWNPHADLNKDGVINILDAIVISYNYGKTVHG